MTVPTPATRIVHRGDPDYPVSLYRLGAAAPARLAIRGDPALLRDSLTALFASVQLPGDALLAAYDLAVELRDAGIAVIGGFQSPAERECLDLLLRGAQPVVVCPARALAGMRITAEWARAVAEGRLALVSPFPDGPRRPTAAMSEARNRVVAALAERVVVLHATPAGRVHRLAREAIRWGVPVFCPGVAANADLLVLGAAPLPCAGAT